MAIEKNYDFCKRLLEVHKKDRRNKVLLPEKDEFEFKNLVKISISKEADIVATTAAKDFADYLLTSMNVPAYIDFCDETEVGGVLLKINKDLGDASERRGHRITVDESVLIEGFDGAGIAQALYYLEDVMNLREAPFLKKGSETRRIMFAPRVVMSGYSMDEYPDDYLNLLAHHGFSGISLWIKGPNETQKGYLNFTDLANRAEKYGLGIYIMSYAKHDVYPEGDEAQKYYDKLYGDLFAQFPFIKGLTIVGEAVDFVSRDTRVPKGVNPSFFPCNDWHLLLRMIRKAVDKAKPDVEIIICSYNWGFYPQELREELIASLPKDVILECGWEMFEEYDLDGVREACNDYSLRCAEPGKYFKSEAAATGKYGLKLKTISNTGGRIWDFGAIPFVPAPYRWAERHEAMRKAYFENNLSATTESIHYGVYPSFITEIAKWAFAVPMVDLNEMIPKILAMHFGKAEIDKVDAAMKFWSEALANMVPTNEDQYGALRVGPAYPFYSGLEPNKGVSAPQDKFAMSKLAPGMFHNTYFYVSRGDAGDKRIPKEIVAYEHVKACFEKGLELLESVTDKNEELTRLIGMGHFMRNTIVSVLNMKQFFIRDQKRQKTEDKEEKARLINEMIEILKAESENAVDTIPLVEADSSLGFEPSLEYITDRKRLEWKLGQVETEIEKLKAQK